MYKYIDTNTCTQYLITKEDHKRKQRRVKQNELDCMILRMVKRIVFHKNGLFTKKE